jgi:toxin YoeB|uniref:Txe/YoeB family addiction module toxin n=1 Tax=Roseivirga sp. TaxID=1964215 RepID=UPI00404880A4
MKYVFVDESWEDYLYWQKTDKAILKRINELIKDISRNPFSGIGKPEPLKYKYSGYWSRRINQEHRIIYQVRDEEVIILKCRYHYD